MTKRTSTTTRTLSVVAAPGRNGKVTFKEDDDIGYDPSVYVHDGDQLYDVLRALLPSGTWNRLVRRMGGGE